MVISPKETSNGLVVVDALIGHIERRKDILSPIQQKIRRFILFYYFQNSKFPSFDEISHEFNISTEETSKIIHVLDETDAIKVNIGSTEIELSYPFHSQLTNYIVELIDGDLQTIRSFNANCAIDALGIAYMFGCDIKVIGKSALEKKKIEITIQNGNVIHATPSNVVFFAGTKYCSKASSSLCSALIFFTEKNEYENWRVNNLSKEGETLELEEALYVSKMVFQNRLKDKEI
jgi:Alkylmercury lyase